MLCEHCKGLKHDMDSCNGDYDKQEETTSANQN